MTEAGVYHLFEETGALLSGHFILTSGLHSPNYFQCAKVLQHPVHAEALGRELATSLRARLGDVVPTVVVSPAVGGLIIGHEVARALGVRAIFAERQEGAMTLRRGFELDAEDIAVAVEDVTTTGGSVKEVVAMIGAMGAKVAAVGTLVDRSGGTITFDAPFAKLLTIDVTTYQADACPLCESGSVAVKPGSRGMR